MSQVIQSPSVTQTDIITRKDDPEQQSPQQFQQCLAVVHSYHSSTLGKAFITEQIENGDC